MRISSWGHAVFALTLIALGILGRRIGANRFHRDRLGRAARAAVEPWDWRWQAAHDDAMLQAVLPVPLRMLTRPRG